MINNFTFEFDLAANTISMSRIFNAPLSNVWDAYTNPALLDKWWGSKPFKTETTSMDFTVGGTWDYAMVAPDGQKYPSQSKFTAIENGSSFSAETGVGKWDVSFTPVGERTKVSIIITFEDEATLKTMLDMGFESGSAASFNQLEDLLASEHKPTPTK